MPVEDGRQLEPQQRLQLLQLALVQVVNITAGLQEVALVPDALVDVVVAAHVLEAHRLRAVAAARRRDVRVVVAQQAVAQRRIGRTVAGRRGVRRCRRVVRRVAVIQVVVTPRARYVSAGVAAAEEREN